MGLSFEKNGLLSYYLKYNDIFINKYFFMDLFQTSTSKDVKCYPFLNFRLQSLIFKNLITKYIYWN
jgi:hypothetical protein